MSKEVNEKFYKVADDKKKASTVLLLWGDVYHLGDFDAFHNSTRAGYKGLLKLFGHKRFDDICM